MWQVIIVIVAIFIGVLSLVSYGQSVNYRCSNDPFATGYNRDIGCTYIKDGVRIPTYLHPDLKT